MFSSMPPPSIPLLCILLHDSFSCVRSFGCHPCASQFPSSLPIYLLLLIPSRWLPLSLSPVSPVITSAHCEFASCNPPPFFFSSFSSLNLTWPVCLRFECPTLISSPSPPCSLLLPSSFLFIYIEMDGGRAVRMDWWMARGHGWEDLGVWWTLLSVRILLKELARSLL